ncbi:MAG: type IV secretion system protein VirB10 [Campylobacteraceae bacterium]|jgi:type IV secretion system protein VirB10|nr:type IV secretion system protein VirB10 [Campylobacteraceae bacterium]
MQTENNNEIKNTNETQAVNETANEDITQEPKSDISDERKSALASRGFGAIIFIGVALSLIYFLLSSSNKTIDVKPKDDKFEVSIEQKTFTPPSPPAIEIQPIPELSTDKSLESIRLEREKQLALLELARKPTLIKSLSGAMVTTQTASTTQNNKNSDSDPYQQSIDETNEQIKALKQEEALLTNQLSSFMQNAYSQNSQDDEEEEEEEKPTTEKKSSSSSSTKVVKAKKSTMDPNLGLDRGTFIPCVLKTRIVSAVAGNIACIITDDVYSSAGTVLLMEKGSTVQGSFKKGSMELGMERLYVIWEEIKTPKGIIIDVSSGATDELGGSGIEGWVDNHYIERFGAAIMLSMIDDALSFAMGRVRKAVDENDPYLYTQKTDEATTSMAEIVLQNTINIPPTLYKNHGDIVGIYVNKDIDFRGVYKLTRNKK